MRTRIKICGLRHEADVDAAVAAGADAVGFVFYAPSPRSITPQRAGELAARLPPFVTPVGLFVNASGAEVAEAVAAVPHLLLQFHGDEAPSQCREAGRPYLRAARMAPGLDLLDFAARFGDARAILLDAFVSGYGGGGEVFDWSLIPPVRPFELVLSGGLNPGNVGEALERVQPYAVDVSSGVERSKGVKDRDAIHRFCAAVRAADARRALS